MRAVKALPIDPAPVVEHEVDRMEFRLRYGARFARSSTLEQGFKWGVARQLFDSTVDDVVRRGEPFAVLRGLCEVVTSRSVSSISEKTEAVSARGKAE